MAPALACRLQDGIEGPDHSVGILDGLFHDIPVFRLITPLQQGDFHPVADAGYRAPETMRHVIGHFPHTRQDLLYPLEHVVEAMQKLSPGYQAVFNLYVMEDMTHKEIAEKLGISEGTSKSNLSKAKMNLKKILTERQ